MLFSPCPIYIYMILLLSSQIKCSLRGRGCSAARALLRLGASGGQCRHRPSTEQGESTDRLPLCCGTWAGLASRRCHVALLLPLHLWPGRGGGGGWHCSPAENPWRSAAAPMVPSGLVTRHQGWGSSGILVPASLTWDSRIPAGPGKREGAQGCDLFLLCFVLLYLFFLVPD